MLAIGKRSATAESLVEQVMQLPDEITILASNVLPNPAAAAEIDSAFFEKVKKS